MEGGKPARKWLKALLRSRLLTKQQCRGRIEKLRLNLQDVLSLNSFVFETFVVISTDACFQSSTRVYLTHGGGLFFDMFSPLANVLSYYLLSVTTYLLGFVSFSMGTVTDTWFMSSIFVGEFYQHSVQLARLHAAAAALTAVLPRSHHVTSTWICVTHSVTSRVA